jgi:hypothetical protein
VRVDLLDAAGNLVASSIPSRAWRKLWPQSGRGNVPPADRRRTANNPPTGYTDCGSLTIQIIDAGGLATIAVSDVTVSESAGRAVFTVTLSGTITEPVTVDYLTADDTARAGSDYTTTQGTHTFTPGGSNQFQVAVPIVGDTAYETVERFFLRLQNASSWAMISDGQGIGTINDNDIALAISNWSTREGSPTGAAVLRDAAHAVHVYDQPVGPRRQRSVRPLRHAKRHGRRRHRLQRRRRHGHVRAGRNREDHYH